MKNIRKVDLITIGRSSIDLYSQNIGSKFEEIKGFDAFVGGSPLNIAVGCSRLGLDTEILTGVGNDKVGDFILNFLKKENINIKNIPKINGSRTSAVLLGIEPPNNFPLVFYRDNAADSMININHVNRFQIERCKILVISGTALNKEPSRSAVIHAIKIANKNNIPIIHDLDFRLDQWKNVSSFGKLTKSILPLINIVIGTEEEILAINIKSKNQVKISNQQISSPKIKGNLSKQIKNILSYGVDALIVKKGAKGVEIYNSSSQSHKVEGFPIKVLNVLGAGDAFASGFIYGYLKGWDLKKSCKMGNACGALVVLQPGCANFMPTLNQALKFINKHGGF